MVALQWWFLLALLKRSYLVDALTTRSPPPPPPWTFQASRIHYQFLAVPTAVAHPYCPTSNTTSSPLQLLSLAGWTLGGVFTVEYASSPVGPYREVAVLAGLVVAHGPPSSLLLLSLGAWASHIWVNATEAANYGRQFWGLPARVVPMDVAGAIDNKQHGDDNDALEITFAENQIQWKGWGDEKANDAIRHSDKKKSSWQWLDLSLPSFSGCLKNTDDDTVSPLLRYPLRVARPQSLSFSWDATASFSFESASIFPEMREAQDIIQQSVPLVSFRIENVELEAGVPTEIL